MTTRIDGGNVTKTDDGAENGIVMAATVIQTDEIARETGARDVATTEIKRPYVEVNTFFPRIECPYTPPSRKA